MDEMAPWGLDASTAERLHRAARADQWGVSRDRFTRALERGVRHAFGADTPEPTQLERHLASLRLEDLALACACADGHDAAWEHFIREYRPVLYRAASSIDPSSGPASSPTRAAARSSIAWPRARAAPRTNDASSSRRLRGAHSTRKPAALPLFTMRRDPFSFVATTTTTAVDAGAFA